VSFDIGPFDATQTGVVISANARWTSFDGLQFRLKRQRGRPSDVSDEVFPNTAA
jgi:hypothetical protein